MSNVYTRKWKKLEKIDRTVVCKQCGKSFDVSPYRSEKAKFCSFKCRNLSYIGKTKEKTGITKNCLVCEKEFYCYKSASHQKFCSKICMHKGREKENFSKENHWNWKGGVTDMNQYGRKLLEYNIWRVAVFTRDNYSCTECSEHGGKLQAHHIKSWILFPELRYAIDNGKTLCEECHKKTDNFGIKAYYLNRKEIYV